MFGWGLYNTFCCCEFGLKAFQTIGQSVHPIDVGHSKLVALAFYKYDEGFTSESDFNGIRKLVTFPKSMQDFLIDSGKWRLTKLGYEVAKLLGYQTVVKTYAFVIGKVVSSFLFWHSTPTTSSSLVSFVVRSMGCYLISEKVAESISGFFLRRRLTELEATMSKKMAQAIQGVFNLEETDHLYGFKAYHRNIVMGLLRASKKRLVVVN